MISTLSILMKRISKNVKITAIVKYHICITIAIFATAVTISNRMNSFEGFFKIVQ